MRRAAEKSGYSLRKPSGLTASAPRPPSEGTIIPLHPQGTERRSSQTLCLTFRRGPLPFMVMGDQRFPKEIPTFFAGPPRPRSAGSKSHFLSGFGLCAASLVFSRQDSGCRYGPHVQRAPVGVPLESQFVRANAFRGALRLPLLPALILPRQGSERRYGPVARDFSHFCHFPSRDRILGAATVLSRGDFQYVAAVGCS